MDILTPGTWQDSYESRFISFYNEVSCLQDVLNVLKCEFEGDRHKFDGEFTFNTYDIVIYNDELERVADWRFHPKTMELEVIPPMEFVDYHDGEFWYRYPLGEQKYKIPVYYPDRAYKYD